MRVTLAVKARVKATLEACIVKANARYNRTFKYPTVLYTKRGRTAGTANDSKYSVNFNATLLMENIDAFMARTVVHEFAHLVDGIVNPETRETDITYTRSGKLKRTKRDIHGPTWKSIMRVLGADPSRCHSYDTTNSRVKRAPTRKHVWKCGCGNGQVNLTDRKHKKQLIATGDYGYYQRGHTARRCGKYSYFGIEGATLQPMPLAADGPAPAPKPTGKVSKLDQCRALYNKHTTRDNNIRDFIGLGKCTPAGAATYYAKIKKEV